MQVEEMEDLELESLTRPEVEQVDEIVEEAKQEEVSQVPESEVPAPPTNEQLLALVKDLQRQIEDARKAPKNQVPGKAGNSTYMRKGPMSFEGKVPQQQADLAKILTNRMPTGETFSEAQVFGFLQEDYLEFPSLANSRQDVTYLFRYYRGLKKEGKHAGFVARDFLVVK